MNETTGGCRKLMIPLVRRIYPNLLDILSVQPLIERATRCFINYRLVKKEAKVNWKKTGF